MSPPSISTTMGFVRRHPVTLCCLILLLLMHPVHHLLLFFGPLLISTAIFVVAMIGWGPDPTKQTKSSEKAPQIDVDKWAVGIEESKEEEGGDLERHKTCDEKQGAESSIGPEGERFDSCGEASVEGEAVERGCGKLTAGEGMEEASAPSRASECDEQAGIGQEPVEPHPGMPGGDGSRDASSAEAKMECAGTSYESFKISKEEDDAAAEERNAKLVRAVERELAILAASLSRTQSLNASSPSSLVVAEN